MSVSLACAALVAAGVATAGRPQPPVHPPQGKVVLRGILSNYVAPTATTNGSVTVVVTTYQGTGRLLARQTVVLTPQTVIKGTVGNGQLGMLHVQREAWLGGLQRLVALKLVGYGQATPASADPPAHDGTAVNPNPPTDDGTLACGEEECAAP